MDSHGISTFQLRRRTPGTFVLVPFPRQGRSIRCQGQLEAAAVQFLAASPRVTEILEQPLSVWYAWDEATEVITLFGAYLGTERRPGLRWTLPWNGRAKVSVRARNYTIDTLKVNDKRGNPVEIAAVVVWRVADTAQALFDVEDFENFVRVQSESALRHVATQYNYDTGEEEHEAGEITLRAGADTVAEALVRELQMRVDIAGVKIEEAKLTHLAYAPEIAGAMLRRQQADAVIAARSKIVLGAVSMVDMALKHLSEMNVVELDDERRAAMVSNLMVVLCSERDTQPVVNTGTLYT